jgi:hypothetical protein
MEALGRAQTLPEMCGSWNILEVRKVAWGSASYKHTNLGYVAVVALKPTY